jgi:5-methylcytosine-specific restriction enzyme A
MVRKLCSARGCDELALPCQSRCEDHERDRQKIEAARRQAAKAGSRAWSQLYQTPEWKRASRAFRLAHPICAECAKVGLVVPTREVDHIIPHRGDRRLFWDRTNWQGLCTPCHSRKTAAELRDRKRGGEGETETPTP